MTYSRNKSITITLFLVFFLSNLIFLSRNWVEIDTFFWVQEIESGQLKNLFHPFHLIYNLLGFTFWKVCTVFFGWQKGALMPLSALNAFFGAIGVSLYFKLLMKITGKLFISILCALLLAFSYGYWHYSVTVETYILPISVLLAIFFLLIKEEEKIGRSWAIYVGFLHGLATLLHGTHILFFPVILMAIFNFGTKSKMERYKLIFIYVMITFFTIAIPYALGGILGDFAYHYQNVPSTVKDYSWGRFQLDKIIRFPYGLGRIFIDGSYVDELMRYTVFNLRNMILLSLSVVIFFLFFYFLLLFIVSFRSIYSRYSYLIKLSLTWIASYSIFNLWWKPSYSDLYMPMLIPIGLVLSLMLTHLSEMPSKIDAGIMAPWCAMVLVGLIFAINFFGEILPGRDINNNEGYQLVDNLMKYASDGDLLLMPNRPFKNTTMFYPVYFFGKKFRYFSIAETTQKVNTGKYLEEVKREVDDAINKGRKVFIAGHELSPLRLSGINYGELSSFYSRYRSFLKPVFGYNLFGKSYKMYELKKI